LAFAVTTLVCLVLAGYLAWQPNGVYSANIVDDVSEAAGAALAALGCGFAARRLGAREGRPWLLLAIGLAAWCAGQVITCWYEVVRNVDTPFPGLADIGFLTFPPLAVLAVHGLARGGADRRWFRSLLDGLILVSALIVIAWYTALGQVWASRSGGPLSVTVSVAYPASDIMLAAAAFLGVGRAPRDNRSSLRILTAGMLAMAVADSAFSFLLTLEDFGVWQAADAAWPLAFAMMAIAAWRAAPASGEDPTRASSVMPSWSEIVLPYIPLLTALALLIGESLATRTVDPVAEITGAVALALVFARQLLVVADNRALIKAVQHQAFHDPLTALANRALFADRLQHAADLHQRDRRPFAVLFLDLDDFKSVNDTLGHPVGDQLLVLLAERLRISLGAADTVARLGGDEFAVLLEDADPIAVSLRLLSTMERPFTPHGHTVSISMSIGVVLSDEPQAEPFEYLRQADLALYAAKAAGKNTYHVYSPTLDIPQQQRRAVRDTQLS
jgi:diguanylate cyclase (GGDEF)-like protein